MKERVERAAIDLFAERGVDGVSIADIASAAGVSQGALYRHYRGKDALATQLFSAAYHRTGFELAAIRDGEHGFAACIGAMIAHFCALYDSDPAVFRFMLIAQHNLLPRTDRDGATPVAAVEVAVAQAIAAGDLAAIDVAAASAAIMGIILQTATFHLYDRLAGPLAPRAPALTRAAIAAVVALAADA